MAEDYIEQYQRLAAAVVEKAVKDYKRALKRKHRRPSDTEAVRVVNECERFFMNEFDIYSDLDGKSIMRAVKEMVGEEIRDEQRKNEAIQKK